MGILRMVQICVGYRHVGKGQIISMALSPKSRERTAWLINLSENFVGGIVSKGSALCYSARKATPIISGLSTNKKIDPHHESMVSGTAKTPILVFIFISFSWPSY